MRRAYYLGIYLPLLSIFFTFYVLVLIVIFLKRKDKLLGSTFFAISFFLGITELSEVIASHFLNLMPMYGVLVDEIYLTLGGIFPAICNYVPITLGTLQYMIISICSLNRFFVIFGATGKKKVRMEFYDKCTVALCISAIIVCTLVYSPIIFAAKSIYVDYRINKTYSDDEIMAARCIYDNQSVLAFNNLFLFISKCLNVIFALAVYSIIFVMFRSNKNNQQTNSKDYTREAKLAGAVFIHTLVAAAGTFFFVALLYIWPEDLVDLLDPIYFIEDIGRMLSPILLMLFSRPLQLAFIQIYWLRKKSTFTTLIAKTVTTPRSQGSKIIVSTTPVARASRF